MTNFVDERHCLYVGWVVGIALRNGVPAKPILDDAGNYTDRIAFTGWDASDGVVVEITMIVPPPPVEWELP